MSGSQIAFLVAQVLGGLALFIYGMQVMSDGLKRAAGNKLRDLLYHLTRNRLAALGIGTVVGFLVHSSATTVMVVGFINAGLMTLVQSIAVILGANVGTTLSMQLISFKLDEYAFFAVAAGLLLQLAGRRDLVRHIGSVLFGFGLLFLGMKTMAGGVAPLKGGPLEAVLQSADASTVAGLLLGFLISTTVTGVIQSSGATVGVLFALGSAGVFTEFRQVFPLLLGAHVGTCATALLGSIGTNIEARRAAIAHLLFNLLGSFLAMALTPLWLWLIPLTADSLVRQIANAHTLVQLANALVVLPIAGLFAALVVRLTPSKAPPPEKSHLRERYLDTPEMAIVAALRETQRMARLARRALSDAVRGLVERSGEPIVRAQRTEEAVNTLKASISDYLLRLAAHRLSKRQSILVQHVLSSVTDLERIGDHATSLAELATAKSEKNIWFDDESMAGFLELFRQAAHVLDLTCRSLEPQLDEEERRELAEAILAARKDFKTASGELKAAHQERVRRKEEHPLTGVFFSRFVAALDKVVKHTRAIAIAELQPVFFVKRHKLERRSPLLPVPTAHPPGAAPVAPDLFADPDQPAPVDTSGEYRAFRQRDADEPDAGSQN
jgi:phosphate:Na+ symporter